MKIIVGAVISLPPVSAGCAWNRVQYVLGLRDLGLDVVFVEEVKPEWSVDANGRRCAYRDSENRRAFLEIMGRFELRDSSCQLFNAGEATAGMPAHSLRRFAAKADLLIDISGHVSTSFVLEAVGRRAYVDQDPVYTQLWRGVYGEHLNLDGYDVFFTVGLNIGTPFCPIPDCGIHWRPTLPPVVLNLWPDMSEMPPGARYTTIASLYGYSDLCFGGEWYRSKSEQFPRFASLPRRTGRDFEVLLKSCTDDDNAVRELREQGWMVRQSPRETADLAAYRDFIAGSRGEIGIAKGAYVTARSGWFSDRTASYLACGRPALAQSTGFNRRLPVGTGLLTFDAVEDAAKAVDLIERGYRKHARAARELATEYFDARRVLTLLLDQSTGSHGQHVVTAAPRAPAPPRSESR